MEGMAGNRPTGAERRQGRRGEGTAAARKRGRPQRPHGGLSKKGEVGFVFGLSAYMD
jgi:hypothetical protein